jgi:hypothetical protein
VKQSVNKCGFAMVNMGNNGNISDILHEISVLF